MGRRAHLPQMQILLDMAPWLIQPLRPRMPRLSPDKSQSLHNTIRREARENGITEITPVQNRICPVGGWNITISRPVCTENLDSDVVVMKSAEDWV
jgi:hypothetical protein